MKRLIVFLTAAAFASAGPAAGAPGTNFPEQPPQPVPGCAAVLSNPGTQLGGVAGAHLSARAEAITLALIADACFGG